MVKDEDQYDCLTRPVTAFITFESDDAYSEAIKYSKKLARRQRENENHQEQKTILHRTPVFTAATEPTNIIWENRHIKGIHYGARIVSALLICTLMLLFSFVILYLCKKESIRLSAKQPIVNCESFTTLYVTGEQTLQAYAGFEYFDQEQSGGTAPTIGALKCFCEAETAGFASTDVNKYLNSIMYEVVNFSDEDENVKLCYDFTYDVGEVSFYNQCIKFGIIIINQIIRMVVIKIITAVGCSTESLQMKYITQMVFLC